MRDLDDPLLSEAGRGDPEIFEFEASAGAKLGASGLLLFWVAFALFWMRELSIRAEGTAVWAWTAAALAGLGLQAVRVRVLRSPPIRLGRQELQVRGLLGRPVRYDLRRVQSASVLRRRRRATLCLRFEGARLLGGRWLYGLDELAAPQSFVAELLSRLPRARVAESVRRYLAEEPGSARQRAEETRDFRGISPIGG